MFAHVRYWASQLLHFGVEIGRLFRDTLHAILLGMIDDTSFVAFD